MGEVNQLMTFDPAIMTYKIVNHLCPEGLQNNSINILTIYDNTISGIARYQEICLGNGLFSIHRLFI